MASRKGCWRRVTGWICMAPRWPQVYLYLYSNLVHLLQFRRHTARASLLFLWGLVSVTSKPSIFSFSESCHLSRVYQMALLTRNKARAQPHPAGVSRDHNRVDSFIFSAFTCPGTKHILSQRSPQVEQRYHTKPSGSETGIFLLSAQPPVGGKNREYFTKLFQKMLC